jgi:hypothetical protein
VDMAMARRKVVEEAEAAMDKECNSRIKLLS